MDFTEEFCTNKIQEIGNYIEELSAENKIYSVPIKRKELINEAWSKLIYWKKLKIKIQKNKLIMARNWKPIVYVNGKQRLFPNYKELKKQIHNLLLEEKEESHICVIRHRRGEWGEWFEHWSMQSGKPKIVKEGWM